MSERVLLTLFLVGVIVAAGFFLQLPLRVYEEPSPADRGGAAQLEEFVERLMTSPSPTGEMRQGRLFPGGLPPDLPFEIPLPPGATVVGSAVEETYGVVLLDVPRSPQEVYAFYDRELTARGWEAWRSLSPQGGFVFSRDPGRSFCRGRPGPSLDVYAFPRPGGQTEVRLFYNLDPASSRCSSPRSALEGKDALQILQEVLPPLTNPEGSRQKRGGSGASDDHVSNHALIRLPEGWSVAELEEHYARQLREAGWRLEEEGRTGSVLWSRWAFSYEGERWQGLLFVVDRGERWVFAYLRADLMEF